MYARHKRLHAVPLSGTLLPCVRTSSPLLPLSATTYISLQTHSNVLSGENNAFHTVKSSNASAPVAYTRRRPAGHPSIGRRSPVPHPSTNASSALPNASPRGDTSPIQMRYSSIAPGSSPAKVSGSSSFFSTSPTQNLRICPDFPRFPLNRFNKYLRLPPHRLQTSNHRSSVEQFLRLLVLHL